MKYPKRIAAVSALILLTGAGAYQHFHDDPPPDLSRFVRPAVDAPAYARLKALSDAFNANFKEYKPVEPGDIDDDSAEEGKSLDELALRRDPNALRGLRRHLAENKAAFADAEALLSLPHYAGQPTTPDNPSASDYKMLTAILSANQLLCRRASLAALDGDFDEAWRLLGVIESRAQERHEGLPSLIVFLKLAFVDDAAVRLATQIAYFDTDAARIAKNATGITQLTLKANFLQRAICHEIKWADDMLHSEKFRSAHSICSPEQTWENWKKSPTTQLRGFWLKMNVLPNATLATMAAAATPLMDSPDTPLPAVTGGKQGFADGLFLRNAGGLRITSTSLHPLIQGRYFHSKALGDLTRIALGLRVYQLSHDGKYPATLDAVTTGFAPEDLTDPFGGKAFHYDPATGKVWSVGRDLKDDGGEPYRDIVVAPPELAPVK